MSSPIRLSEHPVKRSAHAVVTTSGGRRLLGVTIYSAQRSLLELCGGRTAGRPNASFPFILFESDATFFAILLVHFVFAKTVQFCTSVADICIHVRSELAERPEGSRAVGEGSSGGGAGAG